MRAKLSWRMPRLRAVGEVGLDYYYDFSPRRDQQYWFRRQLELALELDQRVVIHCRDAEDDCLDMLDDLGFGGRPLLWHCFGLGPDWAERLVTRGWHISVPGTVTYAKAEELREAVKIIPAGRLLLETDCPLPLSRTLSRQDQRTRPAGLHGPGDLALLAEARICMCCGKRCGNNAREFFGLKD
jgi:TatD DNase family protein